MPIDFEDISLIKPMYVLLEKVVEILEQGSTKRWLTVKELAEYLSYSKDRIYKLKGGQFTR